jgi:gliding motility-associated-like protein
MFIGTDYFVYRLSDIHGDNDVATVTVYVYDQVITIIAFDDYVEIEKNTSVDIDILANDQGIESIDVSISIVVYPINGNLQVTFDNLLTYTPYNDYVGLDSITYEVCGEGNNCSQALVRINVKDVIPDKLTIPEGFSPDGDGINEYFELIGLEYYDQVYIKIFNRWGNLIYANSKYRNDWDGKSNTSMSLGSTLPSGIYYYVIEIVGTKEKYSGNVFLKR